MAVDFVQVIAFLGVVLTIAQEVRIRQMDAKMVEITNHAADAVAYVRDRALSGSLCTEETLAQVATKAEDIWIDLGMLGSNVKDMLAKKSSLARTLAEEGKR
jgi:hypothetical protein